MSYFHLKLWLVVIRFIRHWYEKNHNPEHYDNFKFVGHLENDLLDKIEVAEKEG